MNPTRKIACLLLLAVYPFWASASEPTENKKIEFKFGGQVDARIFYNSYNSRASRDEVQYAYPLAPDYNPAGKDLNRDGYLGFSVFSSRLHLRVTGPRLGRADTRAYIEADFMGASDEFLHTFRLRHAWIQLEWVRDRLLLGQTDHLTRVEEVSPGVVAYGSGTPFNTQNRSAQVRYAHRFGPELELLAAAHIYTGNRSVGPKDAQNRACLPDLQFQMKFGDPDRVFGGFTAGYKFLKPLLQDEQGYRLDRRVGSFNAGAFFKAVYRDYSIKLWGMAGQNLTPYSMIGGYGLRAFDAAADADYTNISVLTLWADFETPVFRGFQAGFFAGYQKNLGADRHMEILKLPGGETAFAGYFRDNALQYFYRLSPRIWFYPLRNLTFGVEYMFSCARWGTDFNARYKARKLLPASCDHRIELLACFKF